MMKTFDKDTYFPQYLSGQIQVINWDLDQVLVLFATIGFVSKIGRFLSLDIYALITWSMVIGIPYFFNRVKRENTNGYVKHLFYKTGLRSFAYYPNPYIKNFVN